jgi:glycopeptide antibiotics resistance protein
MLFPLGVYLKVLFNKKEIRKAALIILLVPFVIETYQIVFSYFGLVFPRAFDVDDIMLNTLGGVVGYYVGAVVWERWFSGLLPDKGSASL